MSSVYKQKKLKDYIIELVKNDFAKNGLQINEFQRDWIETLKLMNDEIDKRIE